MINWLRTYQRPANLKQNGEMLIIVVVLLIVFIMAVKSPVDYDLWWHLRTGEASWNSGFPVLTDQFSYTRFGAEWTNHSWLSQIAMYGLYRLGGFLALGLTIAIVATASMGWVLKQMEAPVLLKAFILVLAATIAAPVWVIRPEIISMFLLSIVGYLLYLYKWKQRDYLWWFIPVFILWSNMHGGYILGFGLIGAMISGEIINILLGFKAPEILSTKRILKLSMWMGIALLAVLINPNGIQTWLIPFQTIRVQILQNMIVEWASPDFHQLFQQPFIWMLLAIIASIGLSMKRIDGTDLITLAIFSYLVFEARRNFGPFAIMASPILARYSWPALKNWYERVEPNLKNISSRLRIKAVKPASAEAGIPKRTKFINYCIVALLFIGASTRLYLSTAPTVIDQQIKEFFPVGAITWIEENHPRGQLFNSYNWGGYLLWALRDYPVFIDGRTDLYGDDIGSQWLQVANADPDWQSVLNKWDVNLILLEPSWPIVKVLPFTGWKVLYQDNISIVFGR